MNTNNWKIDLFTALDAAHSLQAVMSASLAAIQPFGFDYCGWRTDLPLPGQTKDSGIVTFNAVEDEVYITTVNGGYQNAPVPLHCAHSLDPISWRGTLEDEVALRSPEVMEEYYGLGHKGGWAVATTAPDGIRGMFFVESKNVLSCADMRHAEQHMKWVSAATYMRTVELQSAPLVELTNAEIDFIKNLIHTTGNLELTACLSKLTPDHSSMIIRSLKKKLECNDLYGIIARATFLRLID